MFTQLRPALVLLALFTLLTGLAYPLLVTGIAQVVFPNQADGSPITRGGKIVGSALIGQNFVSEAHFWGRPSAAGAGYDGRASSGSNLGPTSQVLADRIAADAQRYGVPVSEVPPELLTASGSGLDPHISPRAARFQTSRVAAARGVSPDQVDSLIERYTDKPVLGIIGESRVNVLELNLALDALEAERPS